MDDGEYKRVTSRSISFSRVVALLLILSTVSSNGFDTEIEIMRREGLERFDISIFVEERIEYIHSRITLKPLITSIELGIRLSNDFGMRANSSFGRILSSRVKRMILKVERKLARMYGGRMRKAMRRKRAIEIVGNLISRLFGNPGPEDWRQNTKNVLAMKAAIERQLANSVILHNDIDQNRHAINAQNENLRHVLREVSNNENRLNNVDNALHELESYLELESMFESINDILESLDDIRKDARTGRCNEKGLNPEFLIEHLRSIESNKAGIAPVFASWEWQKYYSYEMCTLALHDDEVWITMRIPIINLAEQLVRALPTSNQLWIQNRAMEFGIETVLFKFKQLDTFMVTTKSNLETCSKLGTNRVCSIRKTKFRETNPYIVPVDIGHSRVIILTNITELEVEVKSMCRGVIDSNKLKGQSVLRVPDKCAVLSKTFEVSKMVEIIGVNSSMDIGKVETVSLHRANRAHKKEESELMLNSVTDLPYDKKSFELNSNATRSNLNLVKVGPLVNSETMLIASTSTTMSVLACLIIILIVIYCSKNCREKNSNSRIVVVEKAEKPHRNSSKMNANIQYEECDESVNVEDENEIMNENEHLNAYDDLKSSDKADSTKKQLDLEKRKPTFQMKR